MTRLERLAKLIKEETSKIFREKVSDPRVGFVSITEVSITADLSIAKIYVSILGNEEQKKEAMAGLISATSFIRGELSRVLQIRSTPAIQFVRDDSIERGSRVLEIMSRLDKEDAGTGTKPD